MKLFELARQRQWLAGYESESMEPFYFDCADCGAKGPIIKGFLGKSTKYADIAVFTRGESKTLALFCAKCYDKRVAVRAVAQRQSARQVNRATRPQRAPRHAVNTQWEPVRNKSLVTEGR